MQLAINWMGAGFGIVWLGVLIVVFAFAHFTSDLKLKLNPDGQTLATVCYVDGKMQSSPKKWRGYFYDGEVRRDCDIIDDRGDEVKIQYNRYVGSHGLTYGHTVNERWIPEKNYHKYHTLKEVSEILNKKKK